MTHKFMLTLLLMGALSAGACETSKDAAKPDSDAATVSQKQTATPDPPAPAEVAAEDPNQEALLLGIWRGFNVDSPASWIRDDTPAKPSTPSRPGAFAETLLIDKSGVSRLGPGIAFQQEEGWWKVSLREDANPGKNGPTIVQTLFAGPKGAEISAHEFDSHPTPCTEWSGDDALFVGADLVSMINVFSGDCPEAYYTYIYYGLASIHPNSGTNRLYGGSRTLEDALGAQAWQSMKKAGARVVAQESDCRADPDPRSWSIQRQKGAWVLKGWIDSTGDDCRHAQTDFEVPFELPEALTGATPLPMTWAEIEQAFPEAIDAVASPSGRILVVQTREELIVLVEGAEVARYDDKEKGRQSRIVMTRWAKGSAQVADWRAQASDVLE